METIKAIAIGLIIVGCFLTAVYAVGLLCDAQVVYVIEHGYNH